MDLKTHPKIHVLSACDKKFWLNIVISNIFGVQTVSMQKYFLKYFLLYQPILVPNLHQSPIMYECMQLGSLHSFFIVCAYFYCSKITLDAVIVKTLK